MSRKGILMVLSGFSGAGKGTLVKGLLERYDNYALSVSATTRKPRAGEEDGKAYFFKTVEEFENMIEEDSFIEYAKYVDNYYGTPKEYVQKKLDEGKDVILEIEIQGALKVKKAYPDTLLLFVMPPSAALLRERLTGRGTESEDVIASRLARAVQEAEGIEEYDYLVINDDLDTCIRELHGIIQSEHCSVERNQEIIGQMRRELKAFE
ncbi:guanylate kinase [Murimonas intestini]|uniref:Guanylate kinase n=1 Tax=Murimonas intestini TaxID=1337051 RepID=A0AB73TAB3_9FIRM|nr:guanylate kinase [Murimonas intestini]MCR1839137.1 guanylate kinase [Murimonas intestini]MCR1864433.1 guanylate kinase [Murimonas intestini]MCR1882043.1 guanylate kinase [Murimonas intestini]